jgi:hypothetical protein
MDSNLLDGLPSTDVLVRLLVALDNSKGEKETRYCTCLINFK